MAEVEVELMDHGRGRGGAHGCTQVQGGYCNYDDEDDSKREGRRGSFRNYDKSKVCYYSCKKFGHFALKCWYDDSNQVKEKTKL